jgi:hypothetical protein
VEEEDDIQEVMPVKAEPRDPVPQNTAVAAVDTSSYRDAAGADQSGGGGGQLALDESYQDDGNYDYGDYGEGYEDSSGIIGMAPCIIIRKGKKLQNAVKVILIINGLSPVSE